VHLGWTLRRLRHGRGWSIGQAASMAGISPNTLSNVERSAMPNPTLSTLLALMDIYKVDTIEGLLGPTPSQELLQEWISMGRPGRR
jgi:transcriptional regulator with XRE-family HTH domain